MSKTHISSLTGQLQAAQIMGVDFGARPSTSMLMRIDDGRLTHVTVIKLKDGSLATFTPPPMGKRQRRRLKAKGRLS